MDQENSEYGHFSRSDGQHFDDASKMLGKKSSVSIKFT